MILTDGAAMIIQRSTIRPTTGRERPVGLCSERDIRISVHLFRTQPYPGRLPTVALVSLICSEMPTQCFTKKGSDPPVCGVHKVKLEEHQTSRESITGGVGSFRFLVCPVSGTVLHDNNAKA
jgi:hypothetical protein